MSVPSGCIALRDLRYDDERIRGLFLPRIRTHVFLSDLGLPVLDGCAAFDREADTLRDAVDLMSKYGTHAIVRSDPLQRDAPTIRGGDVWPLTDLRGAADKYLPLGRALLLLEPYERSANEWSFGLLGGLQDHSFALEIVGPGFDAGHLNRGRVTPHETFTGTFVGPAPRVTAHFEFDRERYAHDLVETGIAHDPASAAPLPGHVLHAVLRYFARVEPTRSGMFVLSGAVLQPGERLVFWDLYDPAQKDR